MPSPTTNDEFLDLVRKSGVVDEKRLTTCLDRMRAAQALPADPGKLAGLLVRDGVLTQFQAEQFLQGRWRRFTLGKYKVLEKLGSGGMGTVYLCEHKLMRRRVAVKVLPTQKAEDSSSLERFYREARAVAALDHPNIVRAYDIDQDDKLHFLVMEHVDGSSLQDIIKKAGPMDVLRACHYIRQAALGLQHAHETAGIVHRDIKPGNILVDRNGIVKILDMGLARFFHDEDDVLTKKFEENVLGTADYLAPEQALDSHSVDIRADIYSLGATFYFCLTGRTPFAEGTVAQKLIWHQTRQPKPLRQLRPEVPEGVVVVLEKMMAKDPLQRYPTPAAAAEALAAWTQTPIPPPPQDEMPQLCLAAMGGLPGENSLSGAPRTQSSSGELSPTPRRVWQLSPTATPTPPSIPPKSNPPTSSAPPRDLRKTNPPPPGPLALEIPGPAVPPPSPPPTPVAPPPRVAAPAPSSTLPLGVNGAGQSSPAKLSSAPAAPSPQTDEEISWGALVSDNGEPATRSATTPRAARRGPVSSTPQVGGLPPSTRTHGLGWVIGIASALVLVLIVVGAILAWLFGKKPEPDTEQTSGPAVFHVNRLGSNGAAPSIAAALTHVRNRRGQPARIIVQEDIAESDVVVDLPNVTIEAEAGKAIRWKPSSQSGAAKLLRVHKAEGFCLKGFTLDGDNRVDFLVNLFHHCPGTRLEDLKLQGFKKYGIWLMNCQGGNSPDRHVRFERLVFEVPRPEQTALYFNIEKHTRDTIPTNKYITIADSCTFVGPGTKVKASDLANLEEVQFPAGVQPVQGQ